MLNERIYLYPDDKRVYLDVFATTDNRTKPQDAMLICPGGGYRTTCSDREGDFIALSYLAKGINSFVLTYNTDETSVFPSQLRDAALAFKYIKENAEKYHINPERIFVIGFSAGGHLAASLAVHHKYAEKLLSLSENYLKPKGAVLSYAVITAYGPAVHEGSFANLLKKPFAEMTEEEKSFHSLDRNITKETPPAFLWHTAVDSCVPTHNSLMLGMAYYEAGVPFEMHIFPEGPHGIGLGTEFASAGIEDVVVPCVKSWLDLSVDWISRQ